MAERTIEELRRDVAVLEAHLPAVRAVLMKIPGVLDVRAGIKEQNGQATDIAAYHVLVDKKVPQGDLLPGQQVPKQVLGFPTDVIVETGVKPLSDVLLGGIKMTQSLWGGSYGTLGAFVVASAANTHVAANTPLLLTNWHVAEEVGVVGLSCLCNCCCECCTIGRIVDPQITTTVDAAIGTLNSDVRFVHEIESIGPLRGTTPPLNPMDVVKTGARTGFTKGRITSLVSGFTRKDGKVFVNQVRIAPRPGFSKFLDGGDSGSVILEEGTNRVVGLNHAGNDAGIGFANQIGAVTGLMNIDVPVVGTAGSIPLDAVAEHYVPSEPPMLARFEAFRAEMERSELGARWVELVRTHGQEVQYLVNHERETMVAWQRSQGPAFFAHYTKSLKDSGHRVPRELGGVRLQNLILSMANVLQVRGSPELSAAIRDNVLTALSIAQSADTLEAMATRAQELSARRVVRAGAAEVRLG